MVIQQDLTNSNGGFNLIEPRKMVLEKKTQQRNGDWNNNYDAFEQQPWLNSMFSPAKLVGFILFSQLKYYEKMGLEQQRWFLDHCITRRNVGFTNEDLSDEDNILPTSAEIKDFSQCWCYNRMGMAKNCLCFTTNKTISSKTWCRASERRARLSSLFKHFFLWGNSKGSKTKL